MRSARNQRFLQEIWQTTKTPVKCGLPSVLNGGFYSQVNSRAQECGLSGRLKTQSMAFTALLMRLIFLEVVFL